MNADVDEPPFELPVEKARRAQRIQSNRKHKRRDRWKPKQPKLLPIGAPQKYRRFSMWMRGINRRKTAPMTGYGVAYEPRANKDMFGHP